MIKSAKRVEMSGEGDGRVGAWAREDTNGCDKKERHKEDGSIVGERCGMGKAYFYC